LFYNKIFVVRNNLLTLSSKTSVERPHPLILAVLLFGFGSAKTNIMMRRSASLLLRSNFSSHRTAQQPCSQRLFINRKSDLYSRNSSVI